MSSSKEICVNGARRYRGLMRQRESCVELIGNAGLALRGVCWRTILGDGWLTLATWEAKLSLRVW